MYRWIASLLVLAVLMMPATAGQEAEECDCSDARAGEGSDRSSNDDSRDGEGRTGGNGDGQRDQERDPEAGQSTASSGTQDEGASTQPAQETQDPATQTTSYTLMTTTFEAAGVGGQGGRETCDAYDIAGTEPQPSVNPLLGIVWLTPEDCLRELARVIGDGEAQVTSQLDG